MRNLSFSKLRKLFYSEWPTKYAVTLHKVIQLPSGRSCIYLIHRSHNTQKRLVQGVAWSLKYPKVFFPHNCTSFFVPPLDILGYPARIEKLPYSHPSSTLPTFLLLLFFFFVCPSFFLLILRSLAREAIYTRLHLANSHPLLEDDKASRALRTRPGLHARDRALPSLSCSPAVFVSTIYAVRKLRIVRENQGEIRFALIATYLPPSNSSFLNRSTRSLAG